MSPQGIPSPLSRHQELSRTVFESHFQAERVHGQWLGSARPHFIQILVYTPSFLVLHIGPTFFPCHCPSYALVHTCDL